MDQIFAAIQDLLTQFRWHILAGILTLLAAYFKTFKVVWGLLGTLWDFRKQRELQRVPPWIERKVRKMPSERRKRYQESLFHFSREIAVYIYRQRRDRGGLYIPGPEIKQFAIRVSMTSDTPPMNRFNGFPHVENR
ncbi:MAG: hypothetical protein GY801_19580 [bacterium]|nr:hypothetical protein [bacterium]